MNNETNNWLDYHPAPSLDFCQSRETYVQWVREWKAAYRELSLSIRKVNLIGRAMQSDRARPGNAHAAALRAQADLIHLPTESESLWFNKNRDAITWHNPLVTPSGRKTYGWEALASWMCWLRREAKKASNAAWLAQHAKTCQEKVSAPESVV